MDLAQIWNFSKYRLINKLPKNFHKLNINLLKLQLLRNTHLNNNVDNYIINQDVFNNAMSQEDDLYKGFISMNIKFSLQQIWDMTDNMINYIYKKDNIHTNQYKKTKISIHMYQDNLLEPDSISIVQKGNYKLVMSKSNNLSSSLLLNMTLKAPEITTAM